MRKGWRTVPGLRSSGRRVSDGAGRNLSTVRNMVNLGVVGIVSQDVDS